MTIHFSDGAPQNTLGMFSNWIPEVEKVALAAGATGGAVINMTQAYKVKYLSLYDVSDGKLIDAEHTSRWRHLIMSEPYTYGEIELDDALKPFALHKGKSKDGFKAAIERSNKMKADYEACVIEIPALRFIGLWLHNKSEDLIMPYPPNATELENFRPYSVNDALHILQPLANKEILEVSANSGPISAG